MKIHEILLKAASLLAAKEMPLEEALRTLNVTRDALGDAAALKSAYRKRALEVHPDRGGSTADAQKVNEAYEVLQKAGGRDSRAGIGQRAAEEANEKAERAYPIVRASVLQKFSPQRFADHFAEHMGQPFTFKTEEDLRRSYQGAPHYFQVNTEWRSEDGETVFSLSMSVNLFDAQRTRALGNSDDALAFTVTMKVTSLHNGKKSKMTPRDWVSSNQASTLLDPNDLWPSRKLKALAGGKEAGRKFAKRDMILFIQKNLDGEVVSEGAGILDAMVPIGEPQENLLRSPSLNPRSNRFLLRLTRHTMLGTGTWAVHEVRGPQVPKMGRARYDIKYKTLSESLETARLLQRIQKAVDGMSDGEKIARTIERLVHAQGDVVEEKPSRVPAPIDFGD